MRTTASWIGTCASFAWIFAAGASAQTTTRASVDSGGAQAGGASSAPSISGDGRYVAFQSDATNVVPGDTNGLSDVFVHDELTGVTSRVSVDSGGSELDELCVSPSISGDGRFVAFAYVPNMDTSQIFVHDRQSGATTLVSATPGGSPGNSHSFGPAISADGRYVAFLSGASDLVPGDSGTNPDCFVRDLQTGTTVIASRSSGGVQGNGSFMTAPVVISGDGRFVAFVSDSTNLVSGDTNARPDIFLRDLQAGTTVRVVVGEAPGAGIIHPSISADGRWIAFDTNVALDPSDTNGSYDVYVADIQAGITTRVSLDSAGAQVSGNSRSASISADGRCVAFKSDSNVLVPGDANGVADVFVRDLVLNRTTRASISSAGFEGNAVSEYPSISGDGTRVAFESLASDLVADDTNSKRDVFTIDRTCVGAISTYCVAKVNGLGCLPSIGSVGVPSASGPDSFYVTAGNVRNRKLGMMLWSLAPANNPFGGGTLCVHSTIHRTSGQSSGGSPTGDDCTGTYAFHFTQAYMAQQHLGANTTVFAQYWSRDPGFAFPNNIGLTDALRFTICD
jgi:Tol biopolymer transport system component